MNVVIYSTSSSAFDPHTYRITENPSCLDQWLETIKEYPEINVSIVSALPSLFLMDYSGDEISKGKGRLAFYKIPGAQSNEETAAFIASLKPDLAVAASFYVNPFDWLNAKDAMVGEILKAHGIRTIFHSLETSLLCFDKRETHSYLEARGYPVAKAVFVNHSLYFNAASKREILENVYKESVLTLIKGMHYPVIIKDTTGLSSVGMDKVESFEEAVKILDGKKNSGDRLVEEYIEGIQAGCEIYGTDGNYSVMDPFVFSVNKYGITSPKQSVKLGPLTEGSYRIKELKEMLLSLAKDLKFSGTAQIDLVFSKGKWYIIEINPRLSGMIKTYASSMGLTVYDIILRSALKEKKDWPALKPALNIKLPIIDDSIMEEIVKENGVSFVRTINNTGARQEREKGFSELVLIDDTSLENLMKKLDEIKAKYPSLIEPSFYENAKALSLIAHRPYMQ